VRRGHVDDNAAAHGGLGPRGDEDTAPLLYNTHTLPVPSVLSAKYFVVDNGKITAIKGLFDRSVFAEAQSESERD
jgi:hypothetical protein